MEEIEKELKGADSFVPNGDSVPNDGITLYLTPATARLPLSAGPSDGTSPFHIYITIESVTRTEKGVCNGIARDCIM